MRIGLISPLFESVPPRLYGGTERVVANLCQGLLENGHEVTLFASGDSLAAADIVATLPTALRLCPTITSSTPDAAAFHVAQLAEVIRRQDDFDVIHNHADYIAFPFAAMATTPVLSTMHGRLDHFEATHVLSHYPDIPLISISNHQRLPVPNQNWLATIYHGLQLDHFTFNPNPGTYLAFLGRMSSEKRPDIAIDIAKLAGVPIKLAAKVDPHDREYYEQIVKPKIDGQFAEYIGEIAEHEKSAFLGQALGMVFPIEWPEPFGLAPVEAWACGTPVLARPYGSVAELHRDGVTGFVRESAQELAALVPALQNFDRARIRTYAEDNFSLQRMCDDYIKVYLQLQSQHTEQSRSNTAFQPSQSDDRRWRVLYPL